MFFEFIFILLYFICLYFLWKHYLNDILIYMPKTIFNWICFCLIIIFSIMSPGLSYLMCFIVKEIIFKDY
jgi:hypothetical protein